MPMSARLLRPRSTGFHPEAQDWRNRVIANGGTVSGSTLTAVSNFCRSIDATSGLRAAILRCNLFCGNDLNACLVPLYRAASLTASVIGNTADTNNNFVSGDFQETGSGGGLKGNGTTKYLNTGFNASTGIPSSVSAHVSYSGTSLETAGNVIALGSFSGNGSVGAIIADIYANYTSVLGRPGRIGSTLGGNFPVVSSPTSSESHYLATRTSSTNLSLYQGGSLFGSNGNATTPIFFTGSIFVFALNNNTAVDARTAARLRMYSIGNGITAAQALAFSNAVVAFNTALGRA